MSTWPRTAAALSVVGLLAVLTALPAQKSFAEPPGTAKPSTGRDPRGFNKPLTAPRPRDAEPAARLEPSGFLQSSEVWPTRILDDYLLVAQLEAAREAVADGKWKIAIPKIQKLLDRAVAERDLHLLTDKGKAQVVLHTAAERLLASLPAEGRDAYRAAFDEPAAELLQTALDKKDAGRLLAVVRRYLYTESGPRALHELAARLAEEGDDVRAAVAYDLLQRHRGPARWGSDELFAAARTLRRGGDRDGAARLEAELFRRVGPDGLTLDKRAWSRDDLRKELAKAGPPAADGWLLPGGDAARSARADGGMPYLGEIWKTPMIRKDAAKAKVIQALRKIQEGGQPVLTPYQPIFVAADVKGQRTPLTIYRNYSSLVAVRMTNGKMEWESPSAWSLDRMASDNKGGRMAALDAFWSFYVAGNSPTGYSAPRPQAVVENSALGMLSSDGRLVFAVEDLQMPPTPLLTYDPQWGGPNPNVPGYQQEVKDAIAGNRLQAVVAASGKVAWELGGKYDSELRDTYFLGSPLPLGGNLYVLNQKGLDLRLVRLEPRIETEKKGDEERPIDRVRIGSVKRLASASAQIDSDPIRRIRACPLAYADGVLVCPTNDGTVFGVDVLTGDVRWTHHYRDRADGPEEWELGMGRNRPLPPGWIHMPDGTARPLLVTRSSGWQVTPPVIVEGKVVLTAPDSAALVCLDLKDGARLWSRRKTADDQYLAGVFGGKVLVVGKTFCRTFDLADGSVAWTARTGLPSGLGAAAAGVYYLPLKEGAQSKKPEVCALNMASGRVLARVQTPRNEAPGNLVFAAGRLLSQSPTEVMLYPLLKERLAELDAALDQKPDDRDLLRERGLARLQEGELREAIADLQKALSGKLERGEALMRARAGYLDAVAALMRSDFAAGEKLVAEYERVTALGVEDVEESIRKRQEAEARSRRADLLILRGAGYESRGRVLEALAVYLDLAGLEIGDERLTPSGDASLEVAPAVWARGRIERLFDAATPEQRKLLDAEVEKRFKALRDGKDVNALRAFVFLFGGGDAALLLAERLIEDGAALEAERLLHRLRRDDPVRAPKALLLLAKTAVARRRFEDAVFYYRLLARDFKAVKVDGDKTGADLFEELQTDKRFLPYLVDPAEPKWGKIRSIVDEERGRFPMPKLLAKRIEAVDGLPFFRGRRLGLTPGKGNLALVNQEGTEAWTLDLPERLRDDDAVLLNPNAPLCRSLGRLLLAPFGSELVALDGGSGRLLWRRDLLPHLKRPLGDDDLRLTAETVCVSTNDGVEALDPLSGRVRWRRSGLGERRRLEADDQLLYVVETVADDPTVMHAFRLADGSAVPVKDFSDRYRNKLRMDGGRLLWSIGRDANKVTLGVYDVRSAKDVWKQDYPAGSIVLRSQDPARTGVITLAGKVSMLRVADGEEELSVAVDPKWLKDARQIHLLSDAHSFYLAMVGPPDRSMQPPGVEADIEPGSGLRALPVHGPVLAFDRKSQKLQWALHDEERLRNQMLVLERFEESPVLWLTSRWEQVNPFDGARKLHEQTMVFEKKSGKILFESDAFRRPFHTLTFDAEKRRIEVISTSRKVVLTAEAP